MANQAGCLKDDKGLDHIIPLLMFMHKTLLEAIYNLLLSRFKDAQYVKENIKTDEDCNQTLTVFLEKVDQKGRNSRPQKQPQKHKQSAPQQSPSRQGQPQQGPHSAQNMKALEDRRFSDIQNIAENKVVLDLVKVGDLIQGSDSCRELRNLDIIFLLNTFINKTIDFPLDQALLKALLTIKDVRKILVHANYHFTEEDFNKSLSSFENAARVLYRQLNLDEGELQNRVTQCREDAKMGSKVLCCLIKTLALEVHKKYTLDSSFVPPDLTLQQTSGKKVIKDLSEFIKHQQDSQNFILLSGEHREEKTQLLARVASTLKKHSKYKLVVHVNQRNRGQSQQLVTCMRRADDNSPITIMEQVFSCLTYLAPEVVHQYGLTAVKAVIRHCQKNVLFLINWNISECPAESELKHGTWLFTHEGKVPPLANWKVLRVEPYTQAQVLNIIDLTACEGKKNKILRDRYKDFCIKNILSSLDMIHIFLEFCEDVSMGTDFEFVERYVHTTLAQCRDKTHTREQDEEEMVRLGKAAFFSAYNENVDICPYVRESLLYSVGGNGWQFKHSNVQDFMAAKYVFAEPWEARRVWTEENVAAYKRVFKFACFLWCRSDSKNYLEHMVVFLRKFLRLGSEKKKCNSKYASSFDSWDFLLELDEACNWKVLKRLMPTFSEIPCWCFNPDQCPGLGEKMTRLGKILEQFTMEHKQLIIILRSNTNIKLITEFWNKLRSATALYGRVDIRVSFGSRNGIQIFRDEIRDFFDAVAYTDSRLDITQYSGPIYPICMSSFLKSQEKCMQKLEVLKVSVYDVLSLQKVMTCRPKELHVMVNLEAPEPGQFTPSSIELPSGVSVHIAIEYFPNIQQLLNAFTGCHFLHSLSILGLYISPNFELDLSDFSHLEHLDIGFEPGAADRRLLAQGEKRMEVVAEAGERRGDSLPLSSWLPYFMKHLKMPERGLRLLLRNIDVCSDSNMNLLNSILQNFSVKRLVILDTRDSLSGVMRNLRLHTEEVENHATGRKSKRTECRSKCESSVKRKRLLTEGCSATSKPEKEEVISTEECNATSKLEEKEVLITADKRLCFDCCCFPCECVSRLEHKDRARAKYSLHELIKSMERCSVKSYYYSLDQ